MSRIYVVLVVYYLIGIIATAIINHQKKDADSRARWIKIATYIIITLSLTSCLLFFPWIAIGIAGLIALTGLFELMALPRLAGLQKLLIVSVYIILAALFCLFVWRSFEDKLPCLVYLIVLSFDGFSQITGQLIGGARIAPAISPGKRYSGLIGGFFMGIATAGLVGAPWLGSSLLYIALGSCGFAFAGDMLASLIKRKARVKDYSSIIPGHGGILDRFDSFLFAAAILECYIRLV